MDYGQNSYAVVNLMSRYQINEHLSAQINIDNLFDKKYRNQLSFNQYGYGDPRYISARLYSDLVSCSPPKKTPARGGFLLPVSRAWFVSPYTQSFGQGAPLQTVRGYMARVSHKMEWAPYENPIHTKHMEDKITVDE